jgi:putative ABC transport system permease protein
LDRLAHDLRIALRGFRRTPTFTAAVVTILALGIGMASTMAAVTDAVLRRPLPVSAPDRVVTLWPTSAGTEIALMPDDVQRLRRDGRALHAIAGVVHWGAVPYAITEGDRPLVLPQARVTGNFFDVLGTRPARGRLLRPEDDVVGAPRVIVLSDGAWRRHFGGDPGVVGRRLHLATFDFDVTVVGIAPPGLDYPSGTAYWAPYATTGEGPLDLVARLAPGATPAAAGAELLAIMKQLHPELQLTGTSVHGLAEAIVGRVRPALLVLSAAVALLLLIACVNVGSLLMLRASGRSREIAIRRALGASAGDVVRQLVIESATLGLAGGLAGVGVAALLLRVLSAVVLTRLPRGDVVVAVGTPVALCAAVTLVTVLLSGVLPALVGARGAHASPLRADARSGTGTRARGRVRAWLVASQVALALIMLAGAGLLGRSLARLEELDLGYRADGLSFFQVTFPLTRFDTPAKYTALLDRVYLRLREVPGITSLTPVLIPPFLGPNVFVRLPEVWGQTPAEAERTSPMPIETGGSDYFRTLGIPLVRGRAFLESDRAGAPGVVVVSEAAARRLWPGADPIGKRVRFRFFDQWLTVVGVARDIRYRSLRDATPTIFLPVQQSMTQGNFAMRAAGDRDAVLTEIRRAVHEVDPSLDVWQPQTMDDYLAGPMAQPRTSAILLSGFALVALLLAAVGLYGALASAVGERTHELGIRAALGATPGRLRREVLGQALIVCGFGLVVGLAGALAASRMLTALLYEVSPTDPAALLGACVVLLGVAALAAYIPARRATRIDPAHALRAE